MDTVVVEIRVDGSVGVTGTELGERVTLPFVGLTAVVSERRAAQPRSESTEAPASVDLGEVTGGADEHDLRACRFGVVEKAGELTGAHHRGFVDDKHSRVVECRMLSVDPGEESVDGRGGDGCVVLELLGSACGERATDHVVAGCLPRFARRRKGEGLTRSGDPFDDLDAGARQADGTYHRFLLVA